MCDSVAALGGMIRMDGRRQERGWVGQLVPADVELSVVAVSRRRRQGSGWVEKVGGEDGGGGGWQTLATIET